MPGTFLGKAEKQQRVSKASGYSMVEMMVVVAFVVILAAMAVANLMSARQGDPR